MKFSVRTSSMVATCALMLAGCASGPGGKSNAGAAPEIRAMERWSYLIERNSDKAYDYLSPGKRGVETREAYAETMNNRPVRWTKATFMKKTCGTPNACVVTLQIDLSVPVAGMGGASASLTFVEESWIRDKDGKWYYLGAASKS